MPRINIQLPKELHAKAKVKAAQQGIFLEAFVIKALEQAVKK